MKPFHGLLLFIPSSNIQPVQDPSEYCLFWEPMPRAIAEIADRQHHGTSTSTPTTVASAAPDSGPNKAMAVATATIIDYSTLRDSPW